MKRNKGAILMACSVSAVLTLTSCNLNPSKETTSTSIKADKNFTDFSTKISADRIYTTIQKLSDTDDARITGFDGEKNAGEYISGKFKEAGFNVEEQPFPVKAYKCSGTEVMINSSENKIINSKVFTFSKETPKEGISAEVVFGDIGSMEDLGKAKVKDKIVLMKRGGEFFKVKAERAASLGAIGVIFYDPNNNALIPATLTNLSTIPAVSILKTDAEGIKNSLDAGKATKVTMKVNSESKDSSSKNIIATLKSKKKGAVKTLIIGAHYDGVDTPAANDNASGISTVLEVARVLSKENLDCNIKFIAFGGEEIGLVGSKYYASTLKSEDLKNNVGMINLDMVGRGDTLYVHTGVNAPDSLTADVAVNCISKFGYKYMRNQQDSSDHNSFEPLGIPVAYFEYGPDNEYHTDGDTIDKIQKEDLLNTCNVVTSMAYKIGKNPEKFSKVKN
jgi:aminopeptidase YwaD